jgi:hypothetical protein
MSFDLGGFVQSLGNRLPEVQFILGLNVPARTSGLAVRNFRFGDIGLVGRAATPPDRQPVVPSGPLAFDSTHWSSPAGSSSVNLSFVTDILGRPAMRFSPDWWTEIRSSTFSATDLAVDFSQSDTFSFDLAISGSRPQTPNGNVQLFLSCGTAREVFVNQVDVTSVVYGEDQAESHAVKLTGPLLDQFRAGAGNCNVRFLVAVQNDPPLQTYTIANVGFRGAPIIIPR